LRHRLPPAHPRPVAARRASDRSQAGRAPGHPQGQRGPTAGPRRVTTRGSAMTTTITYERLGDLAGTDLGHTEYRTVTQDQVDLFADATDDHQWIHVDPERAKTGPFGAPIA